MTTSYQAPGVYVNEITPAAGPMQGASTSVAAFVGAADLSTPQISFAPPVQVFTNFTQFKNAFKDATDPTGKKTKLPASTDVGFSCLANAVYGFFNNGGSRLYVTLVDNAVAQSAGAPEDVRGAAAAAMLAVATGDPYDLSDDDANTLLDAIKSDLGAALQAITAVAAGAAAKSGQLEQSLKVLFQAQVQAAVDDLANADGGNMAALVGMEEATRSQLVTDLTSAGANAVLTSLQGPSTTQGPLDGVDIRPALTLLEPFDEISTVAAPGLTSADQWSALQSHCETGAPNRFAILDCPPKKSWATDPPPAKDLPSKTDHDVSAIYFPWIKVTDPISGASTWAPPSGHMAGVYARVDAQRGVFKAPANVSVLGALGLEYHVSNNQQNELNDGSDPDNPRCVNCIRRINGGILVWGARTVQAPGTDAFKYISTRRTLNYIRASLEQSTQWAVFEPNNQALWGQLTRNVTSFLKSLWQSGGLVGATQAEAFYVKCDEETNPPDVRLAGQVVTEIGVAITTPAEFVVFNLGVMTQAPTASS